MSDAILFNVLLSGLLATVVMWSINAFIDMKRERMSCEEDLERIASEFDILGRRLRPPISAMEADLLPPRTPLDWVREGELRADQEWTVALYAKDR